MATTVSRRFVFVKMKRKRPPPKPRPPVRDDDDEMVGEAAKPARPLLVVGASAEIPHKSPWPLIAAAVGGLCAVAGVIVLLAGLAKPAPEAAAPPQSQRGALPTQPGYSRSASGGGYPGSGGMTGAVVRREAASADAFLAAPFPKRKPVSCAAQVDGSNQSRRDFSKCLELANEKEAPPGVR